jgi:NMT1/THI5 like
MSNGLLGEIGRDSKGAPLRVVSAKMTGAADGFWYARADSGIKSLKDARGKSIASPPEIGVVQVILQREGIVQHNLPKPGNSMILRILTPPL